MHPRLLYVFQAQVETQCRIAIEAAAALEARPGWPWGALQNLVNAVANISKLCWGQEGKFADQRLQLRASLGISDNSPIRQTTMRNHWEHIDERIDTWWATSKRGMYVDQNLVPTGPIRDVFDDVDWFRNYSPETKRLTFWGADIDVGAIIEEMWRIYPIARRAVEEGAHLRHSRDGGSGQQQM